MDDVFLYSSLYLAFLMLLSLYRTVFGPTVMDRMIGVNAIGSKTTVVLILIGLIYHRVDMFVDIALAYAMLNFIAVLAASRYFQKRKGLYDEA
jgi:multicomponent Na+:H+ antiporter subunit F